MNRVELDGILAEKGLRLEYVGRSWTRGYVSRTDGGCDYDRDIFPSPRRGSSLAAHSDWFSLHPSWRSTRYCWRKYWRVVSVNA